MDQLYTLEEATIGLQTMEFDSDGEAVPRTLPKKACHTDEEVPPPIQEEDCDTDSDMHIFQLAMAQKRDREMGMKF